MQFVEVFITVWFIAAIVISFGLAHVIGIAKLDHTYQFWKHQSADTQTVIRFVRR